MSDHIDVCLVVSDVVEVVQREIGVKIIYDEECQ